MRLCTPSRPSWNEYFIDLAVKAASRSTCPRLQIGAVLVYNNTIVSHGYNGAPAGQPHCTDVGCIIYHGHCIRCVHAELNALIRASVTRETTMYATHSPCFECAKAMINAGVNALYYVHEYTDDDRAIRVAGTSTISMLKKAGVYVTKI